MAVAENQPCGSEDSGSRDERGDGGANGDMGGAPKVQGRRHASKESESEDGNARLGCVVGGEGDEEREYDNEIRCGGGDGCRRRSVRVDVVGGQEDNQSLGGQNREAGEEGIGNLGYQESKGEGKGGEKCMEGRVLCQQEGHENGNSKGNVLNPGLGG